MGSGSLKELVEMLTPPRAVWMMVPAAFTDDTVDQLAQLVQKGDVLIDGGNSYYRDDIERAENLERDRHSLPRRRNQRRRPWLERGYCLMIGGTDRGGGSARSDLPLAGARPRLRRADAGARG